MTTRPQATPAHVSERDSYVINDAKGKPILAIDVLAHRDALLTTLEELSAVATLLWNHALAGSDYFPERCEAAFAATGNVIRAARGGVS